MRKIIPRRGSSELLDKVSFMPYELFYITDYKMIGIADENGKPELYAEVDSYESIVDFPSTGVRGKFYLAKDSGDVHVFNGKTYHEVTMKYDFVKLKLGLE